MNYLLILSLLFITGATDPEPDVISVSAEGQVELSADIIQFNINLNAEADQPQKAYETHKEREEALVQLLKEYDIEEKEIQYEPISISKSNGYNQHDKEEPRYRTRQAVRLKLHDFNIYEKIQIGLIENDFDSFSGQFLSSKEEEGKGEAIKKSVQNAKEKAKLLAQEAGVKLGNITNISYNKDIDRPLYQRSAMEMSDSSNQLTQFEPTVMVSARVSIDFEIVTDS